MATATMLKVYRSSVEQGLAVNNPFSVFARDFGLFLLLVPALWAALVLYRLHLTKNDSLYTVSGIILLILLFGFFCFTAFGAVSFHILVMQP